MEKLDANGLIPEFAKRPVVDDSAYDALMYQSGKELANIRSHIEDMMGMGKSHLLSKKRHEREQKYLNAVKTIMKDVVAKHQAEINASIKQNIEEMVKSELSGEKLKRLIGVLVESIILSELKKDGTQKLVREAVDETMKTGMLDAMGKI